MEGRTLFGKQRRSLPALFRELKQLTIGYAKQETLDPLKSLGRFVAFGIAGSLFLGIGFVFLALAALRAMQTETGDHFTNHLTWIPYVVTFAACLLVTSLSVWAIFGAKRREKRRHAERELSEV